MTAALVIVFVLAYAAIAFEQPLKVNKSAIALAGAGLLWTIYAMADGAAPAGRQLDESLVTTAQIVFFLMGAMTVVEVVDAHDGFVVITSRLKSRTLATLTIAMSLVAFFLSAVLDNLTTALVMVAMLNHLLRDSNDRLMLAGMVVIAANAGGAWSPIGDVTTTMLWIGGQVTAVPIVTRLILPSLVNMLIPLAFVAWRLRGKPVVAPDEAVDVSHVETTPFERGLMLSLGVVILLMVPVFKAVTHLPPFLGILFALGIMWVIGDLVRRGQGETDRRRVTIADALTRIDMAALVFFLGILLAVATLEHSGVLAAIAAWLDATVGRLDLIVLSLGLLSAVVDNVPIVAAAMGMFDPVTHPPDSFLWEFLAYCAGTGGSILIIGSAAGIAAMGIEKIAFGWYLRRFGPLALIGYIVGALVYIFEARLLA